MAFQSAFWKEFFHLHGTKLCMSTAHHPQSDGQTERLKRCVETYLRCMIHQHPKKWNFWLPLAEWWYNTSYHTTIHSSRFKALYGYDPPQLSLGPYLQDAQTSTQTLIQDRQQMVQLMREDMLQAQSRMKLYVDKKRTERESFRWEIWSFSKYNLLRGKNTLLSRPTKLSMKYFGPLKVMERIGPVAN